MHGMIWFLYLTNIYPKSILFSSEKQVMDFEEFIDTPAESLSEADILSYGAQLLIAVEDMHKVITLGI